MTRSSEREGSGVVSGAFVGRPSKRGRHAARVLAGISFAVLASACEPGTGYPGGLEVGDAAPAYSIQDLSGDPVELAEFAGDPVLLNFWATWCTPCRTETPFLQSIHERYRDRGLRVVGVSMDSPGSREQIRGFAEEMGVTYEILHDPQQKGENRFSLIGLPSTFILDRAGEIRFVRIGPVSEDDRDFLAALEEVSS